MNIIKITDFFVNEIYSIYFVLLLFFCGLLSIFFDTDHAYFFGQYKDYVISFFFGLFNIGFAMLLIIINIIDSYFIR